LAGRPELLIEPGAAQEQFGDQQVHARELRGVGRLAAEVARGIELEGEAPHGGRGE
jgi:hypothetical protein